MKAVFLLALCIVIDCSMQGLSGFSRTLPYLALVSKRWCSPCASAKLPALCVVSQENLQLKARIKELEAELGNVQKELNEALSEASEIQMALQLRCLEDDFEKRFCKVIIPEELQ